MRLIRRTYTLAAAGLLLAASAGFGCAPPSTVRSSVAADLRAEDLRPIAVLPFRVANGTKDAPVLKNVGVAAGAPDLLTQVLVEDLGARRDVELVPVEVVEAALAKASADLRRGPIAPLASWLGKEVRARAVMGAEVVVYEERRGGSYGVEQPASVGIDLVLVRAGTQDVLWRSAYYEKQLPLSSDIRNFPLYLRRGGKWVNAADLARYGIGEMLDTLPASAPAEKR